VTVLGVALVALVYVAQLILEWLQPDPLAKPGWLQDYLALDRGTVVLHQWWQLLTYGALHTNPLHLVGNLLLFFFAGRDVESITGPRHTLGIFLLAQVTGGLAQVFLMPEAQVVGISAGTAALVAAFATVLPGLEVRGHLFLVIPVMLRAKYFGLGLALLGVLCWYTHTAVKTGPVGVFVGCLVGWVYARQLGFGQPFWFQRMVFEKRQREARLARMPAEQFIAEEIDPILEKINRTGFNSLTRAERQLLTQAKGKMGGKPVETGE